MLHVWTPFMCLIMLHKYYKEGLFPENVFWKFASNQWTAASDTCSDKPMLTVFWDLMLCNMVSISEEYLRSNSLSLKMEAAGICRENCLPTRLEAECSSEMLTKLPSTASQKRLIIIVTSVNHQKVCLIECLNDIIFKICLFLLQFNINRCVIIYYKK